MTGRRDPIEVAIENWRAAGWDDAAAGMAAVTSVMRVQQLMLQRVDDVLKPLGLTFARYEVLMLLGFSRAGALPPGKVGDRLQVHPASVTNALNRLEEDGFVARVANPRDGRSVLAEITPAGREVAAEASAAINRDVFEQMPLDEGELDDLFATLRRLRAGWGDFGEEADGDDGTDSAGNGARDAVSDGVSDDR